MLVLIGSHSQPGLGGVFGGAGLGVYCASVDPASGALSIVDHHALPDPTYVAVSRKRRIVYAASHGVMFEGSPGSGVTALAISPEGRLSRINSRRLDRPHATMVSLDHAEEYAFAACSFGGGIYALRLNADGSIGDVAAAAQFPGEVVVKQGEVPTPIPVPAPPGGQAPPMTVTRMPWYGTTTMPHAIVQTPDRGWLLVPDAGAGKIHSVRFDPATGEMLPRHFLDQRRVAGPRGLALRDAGKVVYVVNEKESTVTAIAFDLASGELAEMQTVSTIPPDSAEQNTASGIAISPDQSRLWITNRGHNSICTFSIDAAGRLVPLGWTETHGRFAMNMSVSKAGDMLFVSNTHSRTVATFRVGASGRPEFLATSDIPTVTCIPLEHA
ncbi:MAG: lactonase family protein [Rhizobiaceae bacterium]|nr:lactonase family protein [Rhizobiaceae bacterium]